MEDIMELKQFKEWLETKCGYDFGNDDLWMEDYISEHKWRDIYKMCIKFTSHNSDYNAIKAAVEYAEDSSKKEHTLRTEIKNLERII